MTGWKRCFDVVGAALMLLILWPVVAGAAVGILVLDGRPVLYRSVRMRDTNRRFQMLKFRTMTPGSGPDYPAGGDKAPRVTPLGRVLRRSRLDELPQLWNVLRGEMSLVGPRPPIPQYLDTHACALAPGMQMRPGLTGLGTVMLLRREADLLEAAPSTHEVLALYRRRCLPWRARVDGIYAENVSLGLDLLILLQTVRVVLPGKGWCCRLWRSRKPHGIRQRPRNNVPCNNRMARKVAPIREIMAKSVVR